MDAILKSWATTARFLFIILVIALAVWMVIAKLSDNVSFDVDYRNNQTLITLIDKKNVVASSVLAACDCWANTGIEVRPGEDIEIKVSGKINTSADRLIRDAELDMMPQFGWVDAGGNKTFRRRYEPRYRVADSVRNALLLHPKANIGQVLFYIQHENAPGPQCRQGQAFFIPDTVMVYDNKKMKLVNDTKEMWYVWASVNDMLIRDFANGYDSIAYMGGAGGDTLQRKRENWKKMAAANYNTLWFDDNIGHFVISAKIEKPKKLFNW